jgi:uncharacterized protein (DUF1800 family)
MLLSPTQIQHLYLRAGFGLCPQEAGSLLTEKNLSVHLKRLFATQRLAPLQAAPTLPQRDALMMEQADRQALRRQMRQEGIALNLAWLAQMQEGKADLREKMSLFWHGHFACKSPVAAYMQQQINTLRQHALGKFGDLLLAVSQDAAMLQFLNNQQNRKRSPNENFARELLELFTLGRGHYTEQDIKEAARAFTGWGFGEKGTFVFRQNQHDEGLKRFMGQEGNFKGEDIIRIVLQNPRCAYFITQKIYRYFVGEQAPEARIQSLAKRFFESDYDIAALMQAIFSADWFYAPEYIGIRIKSPVELLIHLSRLLELRFAQPESALFIQKVLGQILLNPPNVAGWAEGKAWIDSSSLLFRLQLATLIILQADVEIDSKDEGDVNTEGFGRRQGRKLKAQANLKPLQNAFGKAAKPQEQFQALAAFMLQVPPAALPEIWQKLSRQEPNFLKAFLTLSALPEFQMA